jgi:outer membrane protein OmpA-like peptidoglycan-associated protein
LDGHIDLEVKDLALTAATAEDEEAASAAFGAPVGMAIGLLEDGEGRIILALPVAGTLAEPQVDVSDAISQAMSGALESLFPPTAIAAMLSSDGGGLAFKPITFPPGSAELGAGSQAAADHLATLLEGKPKLSLLVCGRSTAQDGGGQAAPGEAATESATDTDGQNGTTGLAQARTEAVKAYLVETKGLPVERVRECRPKHVPDDSGPPRVDVSF